MLKKLDKRENATEIMVEPSEGEPSLLSSDKGSNSSPSLDFNPNSPFIPEEVLVDQLAAILVDGWLARKGYERAKEKRSDLLPGINEGTG